MQGIKLTFLFLFIASLVAVEGLKQDQQQHEASSKIPRLRIHKTSIVKTVARNARMRCQATGAWPIKYRWLKDVKTIKPRLRRIIMNKAWTILKLKDLVQSDSGNYTCIASNKYGSVNHTYTLQVVVSTVPLRSTSALPKQAPKIIVDPKRRHRTLIAVAVGNSVKLDCSASGYPRPVIKWFKNGKPYTHSLDGPLYLSAYHYVLGLRNVVPGDSGVYTCNVSNAYGWFNLTYKVYVRERVRAKPVLQMMVNVTVQVGSKATLICKAMSDSMPHFQWIRWFTPIFNATSNITTQPYEVVKQTPSGDSHHSLVSKKKGSSTFHSVKVTLFNVSKNEEGKYTCLVGNAVGYNIEHVYLKVLQKDNNGDPGGKAPRFIDWSKMRRSFIAWPASHTIRLRCKASGEKPIKYRWFKDGKKMKQRRLDPCLNDTLSYLKLRDLVPSYNGKYTCIVSNKYGSINHTYTLHVVDTKPHVKRVLQPCPSNQSTGLQVSTLFIIIGLLAGLVLFLAGGFTVYLFTIYRDKKLGLASK